VVDVAAGAVVVEAGDASSARTGSAEGALVPAFDSTTAAQSVRSAWLRSVRSATVSPSAPRWHRVVAGRTD
jgi:hypothetical protein